MTRTMSRTNEHSVDIACQDQSGTQRFHNHVFPIGTLPCCVPTAKFPRQGQDSFIHPCGPLVDFTMIIAMRGCYETFANVPKALHHVGHNSETPAFTLHSHTCFIETLHTSHGSASHREGRSARIEACDATTTIDILSCTSQHQRHSAQGRKKEGQEKLKLTHGQLGAPLQNSKFFSPSFGTPLTVRHPPTEWLNSTPSGGMPGARPARHGPFITSLIYLPSGSDGLNNSFAVWGVSSLPSSSSNDVSTLM